MGGRIVEPTRQGSIPLPRARRENPMSGTLERLEHGIIGLRVRPSWVAFHIGEQAGRIPEHSLLIAAVRASVHAVHHDPALRQVAGEACGVGARGGRGRQHADRREDNRGHGGGPSRSYFVGRPAVLKDRVRKGKRCRIRYETVGAHCVDDGELQAGEDERPLRRSPLEVRATGHHGSSRQAEPQGDRKENHPSRRNRDAQDPAEWAGPYDVATVFRQAVGRAPMRSRPNRYTETASPTADGRQPR
jgi:hypothetical protein